MLTNRTRALEFLRYLVIGGLNTGLSLAVYWGCLLLGLPYWFASGASLCFGVALGHFSHSRLVFKQKSDFTRYAAVWIAIYLLNVLLLSVVRRWTGDYVAAIVLLPINILVSYLAMRLVVFR
jgi:putative flippase GtrA